MIALQTPIWCCWLKTMVTQYQEAEKYEGLEYGKVQLEAMDINTG